MPLPLTVSCFSIIQIGFTFLVPAYSDSPGKWAVKRVCVCACDTSYLLTYLKLSVRPEIRPSRMRNKKSIVILYVRN